MKHEREVATKQISEAIASLKLDGAGSSQGKSQAP